MRGKRTEAFCISHGNYDSYFWLHGRVLVLQISPRPAIPHQWNEQSHDPITAQQASGIDEHFQLLHLGLETIPLHPILLS